MTPEQILEDIRSDRVKKVIMDGDYSAEIDDQYTLAYAYGHEKLDVLGVNAVAHYAEPRFTKTSTIVRISLGKAAEVYWGLGLSPEELPLNMGPEKQITFNGGEAVDCASARFIIEMAHKYDEPIYIITTGPCSSAVNACLLDPSIMDKIVVVWLGGNCLTDEYVGKPFHEWNMHADFKASQLLLDMDIPLIMLPCDPVGSVKIEMKRSDIDAIEGRNTPAQLLKCKLPRIDAMDADFAKPTWTKVMCDYMGVAALTVPDAMKLDIIPAPKLCDDRSYAIDESRRKIIWGTYPDSDAIMADATKALNNVVKNFPYDFGDYI